MPRKEAGFRQLGGMDCMDKMTTSKFAGLTREQKRELQKAWRRESGYNDRWSVEIAFSTFKRVLGECISARKMGERQGRDIRKGAAVQSDD